jgi:hypothetical protein
LVDPPSLSARYWSSEIPVAMLCSGWLGSTIMLFLPVSAVFIPAECPVRLLFSRMTLWLSPSTTSTFDLSFSSGDRIGLSSSLPAVIFGAQLS